MFRILVSLIFAFTANLCDLPLCNAQGNGFPSNHNVFIANMHVHGLSHHNGSSRPGSLQWQVWQTDTSPVFINWMTEHNIIYYHGLPSYCTFVGGHVEPTTLHIKGINNDKHNVQAWKCLSKQAVCSASINADTLYMQQSNANGGAWRKYRYGARNSGLAMVQSNKFSRPMSSNMVCSLYVKPVFATKVNNCRLQMIIKLSYHLRTKMSQDIIEYNFVPATQGYSRYQKSEDSVVVNIPVTTEGQYVTMNVYDDISLLNYGSDNSLSDIEMVVQTKQNAVAGMYIGDMKIYYLNFSSDQNVLNYRNAADNYNNIYQNQRTLVGTEFTSTYEHLNGFFPETYTNTSLISSTGVSTTTQWVQDVHMAGGIVSLNHIFGSLWYLDNDSIQNYRTDTMATLLLNNKAYNSDILEVGYLQRGGSNLKYHLRLWDILTANRKFLYGNGVSDNHGLPWHQGTSAMQTFIWATDSTPSSLISALSQGHMYIGNFINYSGRFYYYIDGAGMGDRTLAFNTNVSPEIYYDSVPTGAVFRLTQALLQPGISLQYMHNDTLYDPQNPLQLDLTQPCFVRISMYDTHGNVLAIGQPIVFLDYIGERKGMLNDSSDKSSILISPNPVQQFLNVQFDCTINEVLTIAIYDAIGNNVQAINKRMYYKGTYSESADIATLPPGNYYVKCSGSTTLHTLPFTKQ